MIKYELSYKPKSKTSQISKEKLIKRRESLKKFNKEVQKGVIINRKREIKSLEYAKNKICK